MGTSRTLQFAQHRLLLCNLADALSCIVVSTMVLKKKVIEGVRHGP